MSYTSNSGVQDRSRTLTASGTMRLDLAEVVDTDPGTGADWPRQNSSCTVVANLAGVAVTAVSLRKLISGTYYWGVEVTLPGSTVHFFPLVSRASLANPYSVSFTATLTWSISIDVRLAVNWAIPGLGSLWIDEPGLGTLEHYWEGQPAGSISASVTMDNTVLSGGQSATGTASASGWIIASYPNSNRLTFSAQARTAAPDYKSALTYTTVAALTWDYAELSATHTYTWSANSATQTASYGTTDFKRASATADVGATTGTAQSTTASGWCSPLIELPVQLDVFAFSDRVKVGGVAEDVDIEVRGDGLADASRTATGGTWSSTLTQRDESITAYDGSGASSANALATTAYGIIAARVSDTWMSAASGYGTTGVIPTNFGGTLRLKDRRIPCLEMYLADTTAITGGTDTTVSSPTGRRRTWGSMQSLLGYRYLSVSVGSALVTGGKIRIIRDSGAPTYLTTSYEWSTDRDGQPLVGAGPFIIDLLSPSNAGADGYLSPATGAVEADNTATTWPEDSGVRRGEGWLSGPGWVDRLEVLGTISGGGATTITGVSLVRADAGNADRAVLLTCLEQQNQLPFVATSGSSARRPFATITTDGRVLAVEESDITVNRSTWTLGNQTGVAMYSVLELIQAFQATRNQGLNTSLLLPGSGGAAWYNYDLPASGLLGGGWLWKAATSQWQSTIDTPLGNGLIVIPEPEATDGTIIPPSLTLQVDYQLGVGMMSLPANVGDLFGHANTEDLTGPTTIVGAVILHSQVYGAILAESEPETSTVAVRTKTGTGVPYPDERGEGASDTLGYFGTGPDWMRGMNLSHDAYYEDVTLSVVSGPCRRVPLRLPLASVPGIELLNTRPGWVAIASVESGRIRWRRWEYPTPSGSPTTTALITAGPTDRHPCLFYWQGQRTYLLFWRTGGGSGSGVYEMYSDDDGDTWSTPTLAIADGQHPRTAVEPSGGVLRAAWVATAAAVGNLKGTWQSPGDTSPSATFTFTELGGSALVVKKKGYDISPAADGASRIILTCTIDGETDPSNWYSEDDGRNWTRSP